VRPSQLSSLPLHISALALESGPLGPLLQTGNPLLPQPPMPLPQAPLAAQ